MEHQDQCPNCDGDHPDKEFHTSQVTCFLCEGTNHVPIQCPHYTIVQQRNQEDKGRRSYAPKESHGDARPPKKDSIHIELKGTTPHHTTKCCYTCGEDGHMSRNCTKKQKTIFPEFEVKYEEQELIDLLALEKPKRKKQKNHNNSDKKKGKGNTSHGYVVEKKPLRDLSLITCFKCRNKGHYADKCPEKQTPRY